MATLVKGNPYTHEEKERHSIAGHEVYGGCGWCGQTPRTLYHYGRMPIGSLSPRWFCNLDCANAFGAGWE